MDTFRDSIELKPALNDGDVCRGGGAKGVSRPTSCAARSSASKPVREPFEIASRIEHLLDAGLP